MRVIAGTARSLPLKAPTGNDTRPTADRIKETLFNILQNEVPGAVFIDMFSGSGGIGIEALSRGAKRCYFLEQERQACQCIRDNLKFTRFEDRAVLLAQDVFVALHNISESHADVIFMDPPYGRGYEERVLAVLKEKRYVDEDTLFIVEAAKDTPFPYLEALGYETVKEKVYKTSKHIFLRIRPAVPQMGI